MARQRKMQFWMDNSAGTLTDYSADVTSFAPKRAREVLDDTGSNDDDVSRVGGIRSNEFSLTYINNDVTTGLSGAIYSAINTSVTKTVQWRKNGKYRNGEAYCNGEDDSGDGKALFTGSTSLLFDGAINQTSVAL